jgi:hypothetical protein
VCFRFFVDFPQRQAFFSWFEPPFQQVALPQRPGPTEQADFEKAKGMPLILSSSGLDKTASQISNRY